MLPLLTNARRAGVGPLIFCLRGGLERKADVLGIMVQSQTFTSRIGSLPSTKIPLVKIKNNGAVLRHDMLFDDMIKSLVWTDVNGRKRKAVPLRDLRLFWPKQNSIKGPYMNENVSKGRPAILPRPMAQCYLLDLGTLKLLCRSGEVDVLYSNENGSRRSTVNHFVEDLRSSIAETARASRSATPMSNIEQLAFELQVLEAALATIVAKLYRQLELVEPLLDGLVTDTISYPTEIKVGRLSALKKSIFSRVQEVQAIIGAIKEILGNDRDMADMYLGPTPRESDDHQEVEFLFEAYVADLGEIEMKGAGMIAHIDDTMQILELHLNSRRNRIIQLSLLMETLAVATGSGAVMASVFGMNLLSGLENHPTAFYWVVGGTGGVMFSLLTFLFLRFRLVVMASPKTAENQHSALKHFFDYIEVIEAKVRLTDSISRREFESIVNSVIGNTVDPKEIDIFFKALDGNSNSRLELSELPPLSHGYPPSPTPPSNPGQPIMAKQE